MTTPPRVLAALSLLCAAALAGTACGAGSPSAATIDGRSISRAEFVRELTALRDNKPLRKLAAGPNGRSQLFGDGRNGTFSAELSARWLGRLVVQDIADAEFRRRKLSIDAADRRRGTDDVQQQFGDPKVVAAFPKWFRQRLVDRSARFAALQQALAGAEATDAALQAYFAAHQDQFATSCVSHILVPAEADAKAIRAQLAQGGDFAALAKQRSQDPGSAAQGGALGCVPRGRFVEPFDTVAFTQPVGQVSDPVQTRFGWHLILVTSRPPVTFAGVRDQVQAAVQQQNQQQVTDALTRIVKKAKVHVDPRYGKFEITERGPEVIPAQAPAVPDSPTEKSTPSSAPPAVPGG